MVPPLFRRFFFLALVPVAMAFHAPSAQAQEAPAANTEGPEFVLETGPPAWPGERILLPPGFARDLGWKGVEEIRFAPGMFRAGEPDFFSYIIVFLLEPGADISTNGLQRELLTYYRGLSKAVMGSKGETVVTDGFALKLEALEEEHEGAPEAALKAKAWKATLDWVEPFATQKNQTLHFEIHTWEHEGQPVVLSCVSPAKPDQATPWEALRTIRSKFRFE